ncbi:hypothetical protein M422DRAFT_247425 [Sphaerobolus stellatus SS14]|nr:hypothetical protein M422DRAFT_247425 [Sphaerobolus stellatus SS14]
MAAVEEYVGCDTVQYSIIIQHEKPLQEAQEEETHCVWGHGLVSQFHQSSAYMMATLNISFEPIRVDGFHGPSLRVAVQAPAERDTNTRWPNSYKDLSSSSLDLFLLPSSTQSTSLAMRFVAILAVATVSAFAVPLAETEVVAPVKSVVSAAADVSIPRTC